MTQERQIISQGVLFSMTMTERRDMVKFMSELLFEWGYMK